MAHLINMLKKLKNDFSFYFAFLIGFGLAAPSTPIWCDLFYLSTPYIIFNLIKQKKVIISALHSPEVIFGLGLILWSVLTITWGYSPAGILSKPSWKWVIDGASTLIFFLTWVTIINTKQTIEWIEQSLIIGGIINVVMSFFIHIIHSHKVIMGGYGITRPAVLSGIIMAILIVIIVDRLIQKKGSFYLQCIAILLFLTFMICRGERTSLIALICGLLFLLIGKDKKIWITFFAAFIGTAILICCIIPKNTFHLIVKYAIFRGTDGHFRIWKSAISEIMKRPIIGYGPQARLPIINEFTWHPFPHNFYLSLLFYSGIIGLILFIGFGSCCLLKRSFKENQSCIALCLIPLISGLTDISQVIKGPSAIWYMIWIPFLFCYSKSLIKNQTESC